MPREEILNGELPEEAFAARLADVRAGRAHPVYGDPVRFFERTHPAKNLQDLFRLALGRLSGRDPSANSILLRDPGKNSARYPTRSGLK